MIAGALGVVAAILPRLGALALLLAAIAICAGVPAMRRGPQAACFPYARAGVVLGMISVLLGFISLAMQLTG
jgi:formate-dependent nitrite reductase membrane component NrfD